MSYLNEVHKVNFQLCKEYKYLNQFLLQLIKEKNSIMQVFRVQLLHYDK